MCFVVGSEWKLLVISERHFVGYLPGGVEVYQIVKVGVASLSAEVLDVSDLNLLVFTYRISNLFATFYLFIFAAIGSLCHLADFR